MEQGDLRDVQSHVLDLRVVRSIQDGNLKEAVHGRVSNRPAQGLQDVPLHLNEHVIIIQGATHRLQLLDGGHAVLLVAILGRNEQSSTSDQLVVSLVDNTLRAVSVKQVDGQEQRRGKELEGSVGFDEEVQQVGAHEPLDLGLNIDGFDVGKRCSLFGGITR